MPSIPPRPCSWPGCVALTIAGRCEQHRSAARKQSDARRGSSTERGYGYRWQKVSAAYLREHPLCECPECQAGKVRAWPARVVDHKTPHRGDMTLFWDRKNWQAMAIECHNKKTATEDGGFGRPRGVSEIL